MGERHVDELYSAAYDCALSDAERQRFEDHLAQCQRCAAGAEEFRTVIDAVRALPAARMPVRVVLPSTPPVAERRSLLPGVRLPRLSPMWGAGAMAAVGVAAVVVAVHAHGGGANATNGSFVPNFAETRGGAGAAPQHGSGSAVHGALADYCAKPYSVTTASPGLTAHGNPAGFSNRVTITIPQRPGEELVLATTSSHYAPGSQVLVFAALTTSSAPHTAVVPCVTLQQLGTSYTIFGDQQATSGGGYPAASASAAAPASKSTTQSPPPAAAMAPLRAAAPAPVPPLAIAIPTSQVVGGTLTVQVLTIPADTPHGSQLQLVAVIPAGVPGSSDQQPIEAVLTLNVS